MHIESCLFRRMIHSQEFFRPMTIKAFRLLCEKTFDMNKQLSGVSNFKATVTYALDMK